MTSIEDARERLEAAIAKLPHPEGTAKIGRAMFSVEDVRTLLAASRREPSDTDEREWEYGWNTGSTVSPAGTREQAEKALTVRQALGGVGTGDWGSRFMRRRPAGPWEVVADGE